MRGLPRRTVLFAALVVAAVLLVGSVGATVAWVHAGSSGTGVERSDDDGGGSGNGWGPGDGRRVFPPWREVPEDPQPAPTSPTAPDRSEPLPSSPTTPDQPQPLPSRQSPGMPGQQVPIPTAPTR